MAKWPSGRAVRFTFRVGDGLSNHPAPSDGLLVCLSGWLHVTLNGEPHELGVGDCLTFASGDEHAVHAGERSTLLLLLVGPVPAQRGESGWEGNPRPPA